VCGADDCACRASPVIDLDTAVAEVNKVAAAVPQWSALVWTFGETPSRVTRTRGQAAAAAVSAIAEQGIDLFAHSDRLRLRACLAPGCLRYFIKDHPRREWCTTSCGNRARTARHYQRHRSSSR
jgi:predicted RNA-binding Zn ribbon-like protein